MTRTSLIVLALLLGSPVLAQDQDVVIRAGVVVASADEDPIKDATLVIKGGKVVAVGTKVKSPGTIRSVAMPKAWVVPGFVDLSTGLGLRGDRDEVAEALAPDVTTGSRLNPAHRDFAEARREGITTCLVTPGDANLFGGRAALIKTTGVELDGAVAKLALGQSMLSGQRPPTSRSGAAHLLRQTLAHNHANPSKDLLGRFCRGEVPGLATAGSSADLRTLIRIGDKYGLQLVLRPYPTLDIRAWEGLNVEGRTVALGPYSLRTPPRALEVAGALAKRKAKLAFVSETPHQPAVNLRVTAALAVRYGLPAKQALRALTLGPAEALGISPRVGSLQVGRDADLIVFDGPPLDLTSRVIEVRIGGRVVYQRPLKQEGKP